MLSITEAANATFIFYSNAQHTVVSGNLGMIYDVDEGESHIFNVDGTPGITIKDVTAGATTNPIIILRARTDANRPSASDAGAGGIIYNSDDGGLNVSDGSNWRAPSGGWVNT